MNQQANFEINPARIISVVRNNPEDFHEVSGTVYMPRPENRRVIYSINRRDTDNGPVFSVYRTQNVMVPAPYSNTRNARATGWVMANADDHWSVAQKGAVDFVNTPVGDHNHWAMETALRSDVFNAMSVQGQWTYTFVCPSDAVKQAEYDVINRNALAILGLQTQKENLSTMNSQYVHNSGEIRVIDKAMNVNAINQRMEELYKEYLAQVAKLVKEEKLFKGVAIYANRDTLLPIALPELGASYGRAGSTAKDLWENTLFPASRVIAGLFMGGKATVTMADVDPLHSDFTCGIQVTQGSETQYTRRIVEVTNPQGNKIAIRTTLYDNNRGNNNSRPEAFERGITSNPAIVYQGGNRVTMESRIQGQGQPWVTVPNIVISEYIFDRAGSGVAAPVVSEDFDMLAAPVATVEEVEEIDINNIETVGSEAPKGQTGVQAARARRLSRGAKQAEQATESTQTVDELLSGAEGTVDQGEKAETAA